MTRHGDHGSTSPQLLALQALREAMADAGIEDKHRIDGLIGAKQYDGSGIDAVGLARALGIAPPFTGALDYPTAGFTVQYGAMLIASGACDLVAIVYARNPPGVMRELSGAQAYDTSHGFFNAAALHGLAWSAHQAAYGTDSDLLGRIAVAARRHARRNPLAAWTAPLTLDDYRADPEVIAPLRALDICKVTAGGVALLLAGGDPLAACAHRRVDLVAFGREASEGLERGGQMSFAARPTLGAKLFGAAGITADDVDAFYVYDPTTVAVAAGLENYGFCEPGGCAAFVGDGSAIDLGGRLPVNTHGGHLSEGYLIGFTHHVELVRQLRGEAGARQVADARIALYGGGGGVRPQFYQAATLFARGI
ncbi:MAG: thiolase family protein [Lautropia sp.]